jgi:HD-GYP domain-containing protein (c-di-GMP phosphodiesterase class II)
MLSALCEAVDARPYMRGHGSRVSELAEEIALRLGWSGERLRSLRFGARLHDVGKLAVAEEVWQKPGRLTALELSQVRRHPAAGMRLLAPLPDFRFAVPHALFHHEHWDGKGYPARKAGEAIPLEARILAVADAFDAMTSERPYRPAVPREQALAEIDRCSGSQFDPMVGRLFVEAWAASRRPVAAAGR